jgi:hypothetical protein
LRRARIARLYLRLAGTLLQIRAGLLFGGVTYFDIVDHGLGAGRFRHSRRRALVLNHARVSFPIGDAALHSNCETVLLQFGFREFCPNLRLNRLIIRGGSTGGRFGLSLGGWLGLRSWLSRRSGRFGLGGAGRGEREDSHQDSEHRKGLVGRRQEFSLVRLSDILKNVRIHSLESGAILCYKWYQMDTTVRNLDEQAYRALRARAVREGRTVGELISEAIRSYLERPELKRGKTSLRALVPEPFPDGNEQLSSSIDEIVYGAQR